MLFSNGSNDVVVRKKNKRVKEYNTVFKKKKRTAEHKKRKQRLSYPSRYRTCVNYSKQEKLKIETQS